MSVALVPSRKEERDLAKRTRCHNHFLFSYFHRSPPKPKNLLDEKKTQKKQTSLAAPEFIYVRIKRRLATYFLRVEPTERVRNLKLKLEELVQKSPEEIRLVKLGVSGGGGGGGRSGGNDAAGASSTSRQEPLDDDDARLADVGIGNDDVLALCFKEGSGWEKVEINDDGSGGGGAGTAD